MNRRGLLAAGLAVAAPGMGWARERRMIINALGGLENPNIALTRPPGDKSTPADMDVDTRALADLKTAGIAAVNITLDYVAGPEDPYEASLKSIAAWDAVLAANPRALVPVRKAADIRAAHDQGRTGVIYGFQNAVQIGEHLERIGDFAARGLRVIQLTYNPANMLGDGAMAAENRGLTPLGRQVVEGLNAAKLMVDLSHSGERTCLDAIAASRRPISINHTGCRALCDLPRNKTDAELRGVARGGGFVGIYFMPFLTRNGHPTASDVVAHIEHALDVCGEDHVGLGTDGDITGIDDLKAYQAHLEKEVADRAAAGIGATGERADTYPFVADLRGVGQFEKLAGLLAARGHPARRIDKVLGGNFLSFAREVWGG
jgi:membrane dipeptidase